MKTRGAWYETGAVSLDSPSSPAHTAPDDRQYSERRGPDPAALSLRPCCFGVLGVISFFGGASTAPAIRGCRACTGEASYFCTTSWGEKIFDNTRKIKLAFV